MAKNKIKGVIIDSEVRAKTESRRIARRDGERALSGGLERERRVAAYDEDHNPRMFKNAKGKNVQAYEFDNPRHKWKGSIVEDESRVDRSYSRHSSVQHGSYALDIEGFVDPNLRGVDHDEAWFEDKRFALMGAARELLRAGEETGNPEYSLLGAKAYEKLGVNANNAIRRSLKRSLDRVHNYDQDVGRNPEYGLDLTDTQSERLVKHVYQSGGRDLDEKKIVEAREMLSKYEAKHDADTQKVMTGILSIIGFSGGVGLIGSQLTGNVVSSGINSSSLLGGIGVGLFLLGIISFFIYLKK